jgi:iron complex transport system substrate-binding protein|tara:strand:- start:831 stop:1454 length:624 start_codon:yes stop_codon:yes gene_type:complete
VAELGLTLNKNPQVISLDPESLGDVLDDIRRVGRATGKDEAAESLTGQLQVRIDAVTERAAQAEYRPKVLQLEWADPLLCGGHWVVEMVERAGGESCFGSKETGSSRLDWNQVIASQPEIIMLMPCGFDLKRALEDVPLLLKLEGWDSIPAVRNDQVFIIDADAYTSRLGPRLVTGLEIMAEIIHPEVFSGMIPDGGAVRLSDAARI